MRSLATFSCALFLAVSILIFSEKTFALAADPIGGAAEAADCEAALKPSSSGPVVGGGYGCVPNEQCAKDHGIEVGSTEYYALFKDDTEDKVKQHSFTCDICKTFANALGFTTCKCKPQVATTGSTRAVSASVVGY